MGKCLGPVHIGLDAGKTLEIGADIFARLFAADGQLVRQAKSRNAIDDAEVDGLGAAAHSGVHACNRHTEHFTGGHGVNVEAFREGLFELRNISHMGQHPQFNLRIVGTHQFVAGRCDEGRSDAAAFFRAHGNVLQIGIG